MGHKDKKKHKKRSRSRSRDRDTDRDQTRHNDKRKVDKAKGSNSRDDSNSPDRHRNRHKGREYNSTDSSYSTSPSPERGRKKIHKKRHSQSSDSSDSSPQRKKHKKRRSRSKERNGKSEKSDKPSKSSDTKKLTWQQKELLKDDKKKQKDILKSLETPEEKRQRRMAKKEAKERKMKEKMGWDKEYMEYTNADNPFGDEHLHDLFVWGKKLEKEGVTDVTKEKIEMMQKHKMIENKIELEKVKKRRLEREKEMEEREKERERLQREKEVEYFREWEKQEDTFHLNQAKMRSSIRITDGRAKPIDLLAKYISTEDDDLSVEMHEPYSYLNGLTIQDLEDLLEDIKVYREMEQEKNTDYWHDITIITEEELNKLRKIDPNTRDFVGERRSGINEAVSNEVASVFKGKTQNQLVILETQITRKLQGGEGIDIGYWESLLQQLRAHRARTRLRERHQEQLRRKLFKLKQEQGIESQPLFPILKDSSEENDDAQPGPSTAPFDTQTGDSSPPVAADSPPISVAGPSSSDIGLMPPPMPEDKIEVPVSDEEEEEVQEDQSILTEEDLDALCYDEYASGSYSPRLMRVSELEADTIVYDPEDDMRRLDFARRQVLNTGQARIDIDTEFMKRAREGMNDEEAQFSVEVPLEKQTMLWSDKYRPRKPRFFNRVHTGFEWNKYNQTHYDIDNPPPKIVQGYKFNIFYPDLIDKTQTPEYTLTPCEDNKDFAALRFHAGPPYEDIAFKIVNREWEYSYKRGFRCQFHNNIFQLWFHFKRYRYRR